MPQPFRDLTGQRFGALVAVRLVRRLAGKTVWSCRCDCGAEAEASLAALVSGARASCGCRPGRPRGPRLADLAGRRLGRWLVLAEAGRGPRGVTAWLCRCSCGTEQVVSADDLRSRRSWSCGCRPDRSRAGRPQDPELARRDRRIAAARARGETYVAIARRYGFSPQRARAIVLAERRRRARQGE
jgi:hypothetical protein